MSAATGFGLSDLATIVAARAASGDPNSYTAKLVRGGPAQAAKKLGEEAVETAIAAVLGDRAALAAEAADLLYHLAVVLHLGGVALDDVFSELARRTSRTGLEEKASRTS